MIGGGVGGARNWNVDASDGGCRGGDGNANYSDADDGDAHDGNANDGNADNGNEGSVVDQQ